LPPVAGGIVSSTRGGACGVCNDLPHWGHSRTPSGTTRPQCGQRPAEGDRVGFLRRRLNRRMIASVTTAIRIPNPNKTNKKISIIDLSQVKTINKEP
jgi:hypothetical protein